MGFHLIKVRGGLLAAPVYERGRVPVFRAGVTRLFNAGEGRGGRGSIHVPTCRPEKQCCQRKTDLLKLSNGQEQHFVFCSSSLGQMWLELTFSNLSQLFNISCQKSSNENGKTFEEARGTNPYLRNNKKTYLRSKVTGFSANMLCLGKARANFAPFAFCPAGEATPRKKCLCLCKTCRRD